MRFDLALMAKRLTNRRRKSVDLRVIQPPGVLQAELAAIYLQVIRAWATAAKERLLPGYAREVERGSQHNDAHIPASQTGIRDDIPGLDATLGDIEDEIERLILTLNPDMRKWVVRTEAWHRRKWAASVLTATGVDIGTLLGPEDVRQTLEAILAWNTSLIADVSAQQKAKISSATFSAFQRRATARDLAKEIQAVVDMGRHRAIGIAQDQLQKLSSELDGERIRQAGIGHWIWRSSHKVHFRPEHQARDGNIYTDGTAPKDLPGMLPFCGCKRQAHVVFD